MEIMKEADSPPIHVDPHQFIVRDDNDNLKEYISNNKNNIITALSFSNENENEMSNKYNNMSNNNNNNNNDEDNDDDNNNNSYEDPEKLAIKAAEEARRKHYRELLESFLTISPCASPSREGSSSTPQQQNSLFTRLSIERGVTRQRASSSYYYTIDPITIKSNTIDLILNRVTQENLQKEASGVKKRPLPQALPQQLDVPFALRCDFCQKFDSLCSNCHRKWKEILLNRRHDIAFQSYCKLPEEKRRSVLFMTSAYGIGEFIEMQLDFDSERCVRWRSNFIPLQNNCIEYHENFNNSGEVYALHVAFAYNRYDVVKTLLNSSRCLLLKSENRIDPLNFIKQPINPILEEIINKSEVYINHLISERAKQLRSIEKWDEAEELYEELLQRSPDSEHAHSGKAKMLFDQGYVTECISLCNSMLSGEIKVKWNEFSEDTIKTLRNVAIQRFHEYCHNILGEGVLKPCGCIILDRVRISIRKLPFSIILDNILAFCDGEVLWNIYNSTRIPLLRTVSEKLAVLLPLNCLQKLLEIEPGFIEMSKKLLCDTLSNNISSLVTSPIRPIGISVIAMADFNMFLIRAHMAGISLKSLKSETSSSSSIFGFGRKFWKEGRHAFSGPTEVGISKQYRIHRASSTESWRVKETSEWEIDQKSVEEIEARLKQDNNNLTSLTSFP